MRSLPDFSFEEKLWEKGVEIVAGIDEVGRGALAGPVTTGCVVFKPNFPISSIGEFITDSKQLPPAKRQRASIWIKEHCLAWSIGHSSVAEINREGIVKATNKAFRRALKLLSNYPSIHLLSDAFYLPYTASLGIKKQTPIIKGDCLSLSIAAASIIAKVERDHIMTQLGTLPPYIVYGWHKNKGYGTLLHRQAIKTHGPSRHHRKLFVRKFLV